MFDEFAKKLIDDYPEFEGLTSERITRALSQAYLQIIRRRTGLATTEDGEQVQRFLRTLANVLIFNVILDDERPKEEKQAAAFVAAEAIALIADFLSSAAVEGPEDTPTARSAARFVRVESALLYLIAQYDACSAGVITKVDALRHRGEDQLVDRAADWCLLRLEKLCRLELHPPLDPQVPFTFKASAELSGTQLESDTISRLYVELGKIVTEFLRWLGSGGQGLIFATYRLNQIINALSPGLAANAQVPTGYDYGRIFHLSVLLRIALPSLGERSLLKLLGTPPPQTDPDLYHRYLSHRAVGGSEAKSRPVLWPSAFAYFEACIQGSVRHAVITMPTGSGKSFIAELAVSQCIGNGWCLYLAPTNALTEQIRGDLRTGLQALGSEVFAFIGDQEYSMFTTDRVVKVPENSVAVMTPEKCALALRLSPEAFFDCRLVVFDECHLLGEISSPRGPVAELVLSQLMVRSPNARFLLMSALLQNPEDLATWLQESTGGSAKPITIRWRPTRTLRAILGVDASSHKTEVNKALLKLESLPDRRKKEKYEVDCVIANSLIGAWSSSESPDYSLASFPCKAQLALRRTRRGRAGPWSYHDFADSWVNATATRVAETLLRSRIQTLVFIPASKHYPFSNASKLEAGVTEPAEYSDFLSACRTLAEYELGCESEVFSLLDQGVAVHTSLMLETEKIGSEQMFRQKKVKIMFATGTLAQGLNLPAVAVVIAGSRIGDVRGQDEAIVRRRKYSQLLNAAGRAGRAGFANQGFVIAIPDEPVVLSDFASVLEARRRVDYLQHSDASVRVESGLIDFLDSICDQSLQFGQASDLELEIISLVAGGDEKQADPATIMSKTYAAHVRRAQAKREISFEDGQELVEFGTRFIADTGGPPWITIAAQRAGLSFFLTLEISRAWARVQPQISHDSQNWEVKDWLRVFLQLMAYIPPGLMARHLPSNRLKNISSEFKNMVDSSDPLLFIRTGSWNPPQFWIEAWKGAEPIFLRWMTGQSMAEIASAVVGAQPGEPLSTERTQGKPLPKALALTRESFSRIAIIAGGFLAVAEQLFHNNTPIALASLPMCIKYGFDSPGSLAWFRFGIRLRRPAHFLASQFPVPPLNTDEEMKDWVRESRRDILRKREHYSGQTLFEAIIKFVTN